MHGKVAQQQLRTVTSAMKQHVITNVYATGFLLSLTLSPTSSFLLVAFIVCEKKKRAILYGMRVCQITISHKLK